MTTMDDERLRAMLAARTPGEWAPYCDEGPIRYRYLAPDGDGWTYSVCVGGHDDDHTCVLTATGSDVATARANAALAATAPALAAEVLRLRAERDELRAVCDELRAVCDDLYVDADRANGARDAACAAARAHLAADDALSLARRTDAADEAIDDAADRVAATTAAGHAACAEADALEVLRRATQGDRP